MEWECLSIGPWTRRRKHQCVVWNDRLLLLGGFDGESAFDLNDVWSWDGANWKIVTEHSGWSGRDGHCAVVMDNRIFVIGGTDDPYYCRHDVWCSDNGGLVWRQLCENAPWAERWQHAACVHNDKIYLCGGWGGKYFNDVWSSMDGIRWVRICDSCPWKARMFHSLISFNGNLYILGGHDGRMHLRDVWASTDGGFSWTQLCQSADWEGRQGHTTVVLNNEVYLMGGFGGSTRFNDVWKSRDCAHWTILSRNSAWSPRQGHSAIAFRGNLHILGGFDESGYTNSMYYLPFTKPLTSEPEIKKPEPQVCIIDEPQSKDKTLCISFDGVLTAIENYRVRSIDRNDFIQKIVSMVALVTAGVNHNNWIDDSSPMLVKDRGILSLGSDSQDSYDSNFSTDEEFFNTLDPSSSFSKELLTILNVTQPGSPLREYIATSSRSIYSSMMSNMRCEEDFRSHFWSPSPPIQKRRSRDLSKSEDVTDLDDADEPSALEIGLISSTSSAALREAMEENVSRLNSLQRSIRAHAEKGDLDHVHKLVEERQNLATTAYSSAKLLLVHVKNVLQNQEKRVKILTYVLQQINSLEGELMEDSSISSQICTWSEWEKQVETCSEFLNESDANQSAFAVAQLMNELKEASKVYELFSLWIDGEMTTSESIMDKDGLLNRYASIMHDLEKSKINTKKILQEDEAHSEESIQQLKKLWRDTHEKAAAVVRSILGQVRLDMMEISEMKSEVSTWRDRVGFLRCQENVDARVEQLIADNSINEELLLKLEDEKIDIKSSLEKARLKLNRLKLKAQPTTSTKTEDVDSLKSVNDLQNQLKEAEKNVRELRKNMRSWYREVRKFALDKAPELFHYLSDLQSPGSLLGDGGFAGDAKLPRRRLDEYENVEALSPAQVSGSVDTKANTNGSKATTAVPENRSQNKATASGRHMMLKAKYDGEDVVLKGFLMGEGDQRRGLERELSILGRLKSDYIIAPRAIVEGSGLYESPYFQVSVFIEYPYFSGGNLALWLKQQSRKPWELQSVARQLLYALMYLHDHGVIHKDIKPSNVLVHEDGRIVLTDFELSKEILNPLEEDLTTTIRSGTRGFMAPEIESGQPAVYGSDMYSFGVLLFYMHFPGLMSQLLPGHVPPFPSDQQDADLMDIIEKLLNISSNQRPTASAALVHPYFRNSMERLMDEGEVVEQDKKLNAIRGVLDRVKSENRTNLDRVSVHRDNIVDDVLNYFADLPLDKMKASLRVIFIGEPGVDEGGLLTEMLTLFYDEVFGYDYGLFEGADSSSFHSTSASVSNDRDSDSFEMVDEAPMASHQTMTSRNVLPRSYENSSEIPPKVLRNLRAFGRIMAKTLYEGRRMGNQLCPSVFKYFTKSTPTIRDLQSFDPSTAKSLQWMLATSGVEEFGLHFDSVSREDLGDVNDENKGQFARMKIDKIMVKSREMQLIALRSGFFEGMKALSEEASPFLSFLSHTDWRVLLCGESVIHGGQIVACLRFSSFPARSQIPQWLKEILNSCSEDHLRQFLIFTTGSPSLPAQSSNRRSNGASSIGMNHSSSLSSSSSSSSSFEINVRYQRCSDSLPIAHTCFFHLDIPDYKDKATLQTKLMYAIQNANTFEIV